MSGSGYCSGCCPDQSRTVGVEDAWGCCAGAWADNHGLKAAAPMAAVMNVRRFQLSETLVFIRELPPTCSSLNWKVRIERIDGDLPGSIGLLLPNFDVLAVIHDRGSLGIGERRVVASARVPNV